MQLSHLKRVSLFLLTLFVASCGSDSGGSSGVGQGDFDVGMAYVGSTEKANLDDLSAEDQQLVAQVAAYGLFAINERFDVNRNVFDTVAVDISPLSFWLQALNSLNGGSSSNIFVECENVDSYHADSSNLLVNTKNLEVTDACLKTDYAITYDEVTREIVNEIGILPIKAVNLAALGIPTYLESSINGWIVTDSLTAKTTVNVAGNVFYIRHMSYPTLPWMLERDRASAMLSLAYLFKFRMFESIDVYSRFLISDLYIQLIEDSDSMEEDLGISTYDFHYNQALRPWILLSFNDGIARFFPTVFFQKEDEVTSNSTSSDSLNDEEVETPYYFEHYAELYSIVPFYHPRLGGFNITKSQDLVPCSIEQLSDEGTSPFQTGSMTIEGMAGGEMEVSFSGCNQPIEVNPL